jgi:hypothetical protein
MIEWIKDKYLTWRTGRNQQERIWDQWQLETIVFHAHTIENMFVNFKYIIPVTTSIFDYSDPFGWFPNRDFKQYMYPERELGDNAVYAFKRGYWNHHDARFHICDFAGDTDQVFVATNNDQDAIVIALRWA